MKARQALADTLVDWGIDTVFALMGAANQHLLCDLADRLGVRVVHGRHESAVVSMADGYARFTRKPGCATVTAGPGLTNTATALAVARSHRTPVLLLAGDTAAGNKRHPQHLDQQGFAELLECPGGTLRAGSDLPSLLEAAQSALRERLPFVLNLPTEAQDSDVRWDHAPNAAQVSRRPGDCGAPYQVEAAAELLAAARRPAVLAGRGAVAADAGPELRRLAERLDAALATTLPANGLFAGHRLDVGVCGALGDGRAERELARCDVLLAVGAGLHPLTMPASADRVRVIRVDDSLRALSTGTPATVSLHADAARATRALHQRLAGTAGVPALPIRQAVPARDPLPPPGRDRRPHQDTGTTVDPRHALEELLPLLEPDCGIVIGGGHAAITACQMVPAASPRDWTCPSVDFGAIGQSLAVAIGAGFARPDRRTVHLTGDGDLMMSLAELDTAVRYRLPLTVIILNDQGFGQERHSLLRASTGSTLADHPAPDFAALADAFGAIGYRIQGPGSLHKLKQALTHRDDVVLIDIRINPAYQNPAAPLVAGALAHSATAAAPPSTH